MVARHDWGAPTAWKAANLRPDMFRAVICSVYPTSFAARTTSSQRNQCAVSFRLDSSSIKPISRRRMSPRKSTSPTPTHVPPGLLLVVRLDSQRTQNALRLRARSKSGGRLNGSKRTARMAEGRGPRLLRQTIGPNRFPRRLELVLPPGHFSSQRCTLPVKMTLLWSSPGPQSAAWRRTFRILKGAPPWRGALDRAGSAWRSKPLDGRVPALDR
jgi:hypothetical protein